MFIKRTLISIPNRARIIRTTGLQGKHNVKLQRKAYPEISNKNNAALYVHLDIQLFHDNSPIMILDTKYKEYRGKPEEEEVAQMVLYSNSTQIKQCVLVYT